MRVDIDVEFGGLRNIAALEEAAAHQYDLFDARRDLRLAHQRQRNVGQRSERAKRDGAGRLTHQRLDDEFDGMLSLERHRRFRQVGTVEAGLAVDVLRRDRRTHHRPDRAGEDFGLRLACQLADLAGVLLGQRQRHIARHCRYPKHVQFRAGERQQYGYRIVLTGVGVDDYLSDFRHFFPLGERLGCYLNSNAARTISAPAGKMPFGFFSTMSLVEDAVT
jgi:hypothetical protein